MVNKWVVGFYSEIGELFLKDEQFHFCGNIEDAYEFNAYEKALPFINKLREDHFTVKSYEITYYSKIEKFDESKVYIGLNMNELEKGCKGYFSDNLYNLKLQVNNNNPISTYIGKDVYEYAIDDNGNHYPFFYLMEK